MSCWLRAQCLSRVRRSRPRPQSGALCLCSSAQAAQVSACCSVVNICVQFTNVSTVAWLLRHVTDEGSLGADVSLSSCVVELSRGPCRNGVCSRALIHFSPVTDFVKDGNRTTQISVKSIVTQNSLWNGYSPKPVEVNW